MNPRTIVSMEQALSLPYATLRFAQLGWRVIRVEAVGGGGLPGDPNRYIGSRVVDDDRRSYFIAPNVGKEAIALNLKDPRGQEVLRRLIRELNVDVFCCNTVPDRYRQLGIDYGTLKTAKRDLIWGGISAMGPDHPKVPGYDPVIQAMVGYMELTGDAKGPPTLAGIPLIDLKAGDELYANVLFALAQRAETGQGGEFHVSMLQAAASWLITVLPLVDMGCEDSEIARCGNEHRKFIPTNVYPTADGFIYIAIGSDVQWKRLTEIPGFGPVANPVRVTNEGRHREREQIHRDMAVVTCRRLTAEIAADLMRAAIPHGTIQTIRQVRTMRALAEKLTRTVTPEGKTIHMQPMAVDVAGGSPELPFPPRYGQHTRPVLAEAGFSGGEVEALAAAGVIAG